MANNIIFSILAETKKAAKSINDFQKDTAKSLASIQGSFNMLKTVAVGAVAVLAGREIVQGMKAAIDAASEKEQVLQSLNTALALTGEYSIDASKEIQRFADNIQKTTKFDGDAILSQIALAKQFGLTNEQAKKLVKTAADLSVATGVTLETAVESLGKTTQGTAGALGKTIPGLKELTSEALKSGAAIDLIAKRFGGSAESSLQTFDGTLQQLMFTFGDLAEEIGNVIVKNPVVIASIRAVTDVLGMLTDYLVKAAPAIQEFIGDVIKLAFNALPYVVDGFEVLGKSILFARDIVLKAALGWQQLLAAMYEFDIVKTLIVADIKIITNGLALLLAAFSTLVEGFAALTGTKKYLDPVVEGVDALGERLAGIDAESAFDSIKNGVDAVGVGITKSIEESDSLYSSFEKNTAAARKFAEGMAKGISGVSSQASEANEQLEALNKMASGKGIDFAGIGEGFKKAAGYIGSAIETSAQAFVGIFGGGFVNVFSGIIQQIGNFPAALKAAFDNLDGIVNGLLESLPAVVKSLLETIPRVAESFANKFPKLVEMLVNAFPKIADALVDAMPKVLEAILGAIPKIIAMIPKIIDKFAQALPGLLRQIMQALPAIITAITRAIPNIVRSLANALPELIIVFAENIAPIVLALVQGIITAIPEIVIALVDAFIVKGGIFRIVGALIQAVPQIAIALVQGIMRAAYESLGSLGSFLGKAFSGAIKLPKFDLGATKDFLSGKAISERLSAIYDKYKDYLTGKAFMDKITEGFKKIFENLKKALTLNIGGGGGGGGGFLGQVGSAVGKAVKFAEGGQAFRVPGGYPNDSFPARLTSGELVVDRSTASKLRDFLESGSQSSFNMNELVSALASVVESRPAVISLNIGDEQLATAVFNAKRRGYRI